MIKQDFEQLKNFILDNNDYFHKGFANAYKDDVSNAINVQQGKDVLSVLPADNLGNYFYLRNDAWTKFEPKHPERLSDTGTQRLSFLDTISVQLIAVVENADAYILIENLRNTAMMYKELNVQPVTGSWNREQVVASELSNMSSSDINAALQRLSNETIVRVSLSISKTFVPSSCINNPINK